MQVISILKLDIISSPRLSYISILILLQLSSYNFSNNVSNLNSRLYVVCYCSYSVRKYYSNAQVWSAHQGWYTSSVVHCVLSPVIILGQ